MRKMVIEDLFAKVANRKKYNLKNKVDIYKTYAELKLLTANVNKEVSHDVWLEFRLIAKNFSNRKDYLKYLTTEDGFKGDLIGTMYNKFNEILYK